MSVSLIGKDMEVKEFDLVTSRLYLSLCSDARSPFHVNRLLAVANFVARAAQKVYEQLQSHPQSESEQSKCNPIPHMPFGRCSMSLIEQRADGMLP